MYYSLCVLYCYPLCWPCLSGESLHWPFGPGIVFGAYCFYSFKLWIDKLNKYVNVRYQAVKYSSRNAMCVILTHSTTNPSQNVLKMSSAMAATTVEIELYSFLDSTNSILSILFNVMLKNSGFYGHTVMNGENYLPNKHGIRTEISSG